MRKYRHQVLGALSVAAAVGVLLFAGRLALAGDGNSLCDTSAWAKPKNPVVNGDPIPDDPGDWEPRIRPTSISASTASRTTAMQTALWRP